MTRIADKPDAITTVTISPRHRRMVEDIRRRTDGAIPGVRETVEDCIERAYFASSKQRRTAKKGER